jgi:hypothetical protein
MRSTLPTEVPPNFWTISAMQQAGKDCDFTGSPRDFRRTGNLRARRKRFHDCLPFAAYPDMTMCYDLRRSVWGAGRGEGKT